MALVAVNAVVDISRDVLVMEIRRVVVAVTPRALKHRVVIRIRVAGRANVVRVPVARRERCVLRMIESCPRPGSRVVTSLARGWKKLRLCCVTGIRRVVVVRLVTADARGRQCCVVIVHVAVGAHARRSLVRPG